MKKTNIFKCEPPEVHFTIINKVPYNKQLTELTELARAVLGNIGPRSLQYGGASLGPYCHDLGN